MIVSLLSLQSRASESAESASQLPAAGVRTVARYADELIRLRGALFQEEALIVERTI